MRAVNLLPKDDAQAKSIRNEDPAVVIGSALGLIVLIALGGTFYMAHAKAGSEQSKLNAARLELGKLSLTTKPPPKKSSKPTRPIIPIPAVTGQQSALMTAVQSAMSTRIAWDRILREFSLVVPDDITVTSLDMTAPSTTPIVEGAAPAPSAAPNGMTLMGKAFSHDSVARLLSRLQLMPDLSDVSLTSSIDQGAGQGVQFIITANIKGAPVPVLPPPVTDTTDTTDTSGSSS